MERFDEIKKIVARLDRDTTKEKNTLISIRQKFGIKRESET